MNKLLEVASRAFSAGIRPVTIMWVAKYYPDFTAPFFFVSYASPFLYKLASLSQINRFRRLQTDDGTFKRLAESYYFIVLIRMVMMLFLLAPLSIASDFAPVNLIYLCLFAISESFFLNREFVFLCLGAPLRSSLYLGAVRTLQTILLVSVCSAGSEFSVFVLLYTFSTFLILLFLLRPTLKVPTARQILKNLHLSAYLKQFKIGVKELISVGYFTLSTILISSQADSFEFSYWYMIGFSASGLFILLFRVMFVNTRVVEFTKKLYPVSTYEFSIFSVFVVSATVAGWAVSLMLGAGYQFIIPLGFSFSLFIIISILNQRFLFYISSRRLSNSYIIANLLAVATVLVVLALTNDSPLYLSLAVVVPAASALSINYTFCRLSVKSIG